MDNQQGPIVEFMELCSVLCSSLHGRGFGENGYMYVYGWVPSRFTWNYHNIVNWLIFLKKLFFNFLRFFLKKISQPLLIHSANAITQIKYQLLNWKKKKKRWSQNPPYRNTLGTKGRTNVLKMMQKMLLRDMALPKPKRGNNLFKSSVPSVGLMLGQELSRVCC